MSWYPYRRGAVLANYGSFYNKHLCIIACDPAIDEEDGIEKVVVLSCCTYDQRAGNDDTCILDVGEHPFISRRSFIFYQRAELVSVQTLHADYNNGKFILQPDASESLMQRIEEGLRYHEATTDEVNDFYQRILSFKS